MNARARLLPLAALAAAVLVASCSPTIDDAASVRAAKLLRCSSDELTFHRETSDDANRYDLVIAEGCGKRVALQCVLVRDAPVFRSMRAGGPTQNTHYECVDYCVGDEVVSRTCR